MASNGRQGGPRAAGSTLETTSTGDAGELARIREILVGGVSRSADERFAVLEKRLESALAELSGRVDREIERLRRTDETKVGREQLAVLLNATAARLADDTSALPLVDEAA